MFLGRNLAINSLKLLYGNLFKFHNCMLDLIKLTYIKIYIKLTLKHTYNNKYDF